MLRRPIRIHFNHLTPLRLLVVALPLGYSLPSNGFAQTLDWLHRINSPNHQSITSDSISTDGLGNIYAVGTTMDSLGGALSGISDAYLIKLDSAGNRIWLKQFGSTDGDVASGVSADSEGNVFVVGSTIGSFYGGTPGGHSDPFSAMFDASGNRAWSRQFSSPDVDFFHDVAVDFHGDAVMVGVRATSPIAPLPHTSNALITKMRSNGSLASNRRINVPSPIEYFDVDADRLGNVFVTGRATGAMFVGQNDSSGIPIWTRTFSYAGTNSSSGVSADNLGNLYVVGDTNGSVAAPNAGGSDIFVVKLSSGGQQLWVRQFGDANLNQATNVSADANGNVYVAGYDINDAETIPFAMKLDADGNQMWKVPIGSYDGYTQGLSTDGHGGVYITGSYHTVSFVAKIKDLSVPEPASFSIPMLLSIALFWGTCRARGPLERRRNKICRMGSPLGGNLSSVSAAR